MNLQHIVAELENIIEQASNDDEIGKESILEALTDVVRDSKGDTLDFEVEDEDHFDSFEQTDFSSLANLEH
tara:strand:+ start:102 stop:314 length:213 start_codon:yes stop_codon:yes gene_type:complete